MMKKLWKLIVSLGIISVAPFAVANSSKIEQVFSYDMIGLDVAYLESIIGIARQTDTHFKTKRYIVDGCPLEVGYNEQSIQSLSVKLSDKCRFNMKDIIHFNETIPSDKVLFGMTGPVTYYADCLMLCGNAYDPSVHELYQGSRAENFRELLLSSISDSYEARSKWTDAMIAKEGEDWVMESRFNCDPQKYNHIAENALKGEKVDRVTIGYNLKERKRLQYDCDELSTAKSPDIALKQDTSIKDIPFQMAYQDEDYTYFLGSQVLEGEIFYEPNDMYGHRITFTPNAASSQQIGLAENSNFVLNDYSDMSIDELVGANYYLDFNVNFEDPMFQNNYCTIRGKAKLQIIGISLYLPQESEPHVYVRSLKKVEAGPYQLHCH